MILRWFVARYDPDLSSYARVEISLGVNVPEDFESRDSDELEWWGKTESGRLHGEILPNLTKGESVFLQEIDGPVDLTVLEALEKAECMKVIKETEALAARANRWIVFTEQAEKMAQTLYKGLLGEYE